MHPDSLLKKAFINKNKTAKRIRGLITSHNDMYRRWLSRYGLSLTRLKSGICFVNHVNTSLTSDHTTVAVTFFQSFQRICNFHLLVFLNHIFSSGREHSYIGTVLSRTLDKKY